MFHTSTFFIKDQSPRASIPLLYDFYQQELEHQRVSKVEMKEATLRFSNNPYRFVGSRLANQFTCFSSGQIRIEDTATEYVIYFEGDLSRILIRGGIITGLVTALLFFFSAPPVASILLGGIIFLMTAGINYISTRLSFPVYFVTLRNEMEAVLQQTN
jgi:hypothetical protein